MSKLKVAQTLTEKQLKVLNAAKNQLTLHQGSFGDYGFDETPVEDYLVVLNESTQKYFEPVFVSYYNSFDPIKMMADVRVKPVSQGRIDPSIAEGDFYPPPDLKKIRLEHNRKYGWIYKEKDEHAVKDPTNKILPHFTAYIPLIISETGVNLHVFDIRNNGAKSKYFTNAPHTAMYIEDTSYHDDTHVDCNHHPKAWFKGLKQIHKVPLVQNTPVFFDSSYIHTTNNWTKGGAATGISVMKIIFKNKKLKHTPKFSPWKFMMANNSD
jgi:hypothetical protein